MSTIQNPSRESGSKNQSVDDRCVCVREEKNRKMIETKYARNVCMCVCIKMSLKRKTHRGPTVGCATTHTAARRNDPHASDLHKRLPRRIGAPACCHVRENEYLRVHDTQQHISYKSFNDKTTGWQVFHLKTNKIAILSLLNLIFSSVALQNSNSVPVCALCRF